MCGPWIGHAVEESLDFGVAACSTYLRCRCLIVIGGNMECLGGCFCVCTWTRLNARYSHRKKKVSFFYFQTPYYLTIHLIQIFYINIIYFVVTYFIIIDTLIMINLFYNLHKFFK